MNAEDKVIEYELQIEDMLHTLQARLEEFKGRKLDDFEQGRRLAYALIVSIPHKQHLWKVIIEQCLSFNQTYS